MLRITDKSFVYTDSASTDVGRHLRAYQEAQRKLLKAWDEAIKEDGLREAVKDGENVLTIKPRIKGKA